ncbi:FAD-binding oxidoreductase [Aestuariivirga sp. YIM B02566]|uniref:FAD-binding protein n=1 Tax=Taklimakanibacter albus TaxID=2800327 RepID=A0ACC5QYH6_9HYPH|nr:FAD-linked oxidase C-terminal domain-containing protein [Aestuariivirga sp. YIM B02566]MBK1865410.1 FAD-binding protein [Aestuariivirga sp. YIM B02566]
MIRNSTTQAVAEIKELLGDRLSTAPAVREQHGKDQTWAPGAPPDAVAFVRSTEEVQRIVSICARHEAPVIAYGTGTSLEGHFTAPFGGISVDLSAMNQVLEVNAEDLDARVQAGVTRKALNVHLRDKGLFFPIDPGADASIGGMAATRASGTNAVRYGTMRENVLNLTAVLANGEVVKTANRAKKSSAGYDLTRLLVGSEGTLGIITEVGVKLYGIPESIAAGVCPFPSIDAACQAVIQTIQLGIPVARIELVDEEHVKAFNAYSKIDLKVAPTLFLEFHGTEAGTAEQSQLFGAIAEEMGGGPFTWETKEEDRQRLWQARHDAFWATKSLMPGKESFATDVCVPISRLAECVNETQADLKASGLYGPIVGHVGDGNFHVVLYCDRADADEVKRIKGLYERLIRRAIAMEGTCTGEHGVGRGKMAFLELEHGTQGVALMRQIKQALDPKNILNPGKIVAL